MTKDDVIQHVCETVSIAFHSIANYETPCDCFCRNNGSDDFQSSPAMLEYVREAVVEKLYRDGVAVRMPLPRKEATSA